MLSSYLLLPVILFPIFSGIILHALRLKDRKAVRIYTMTMTLITSAAVWYMILFCSPEAAPFIRFTDDFIFRLKFDECGRYFAGIVATLWPLTVCYAFGYLEDDLRQKAFFGWFTMAFGVTLGVSMAGNLFTLYIFYELLTLSTVPLVMHTETPEAIRATRTYFGYSLGGAAFALVSILYLTTGQIRTGSPAATGFFYLLGVAGFGVKSAMFPIHRWLPKASVAPTPVTALLHAVAVVKAGIFSVIRLTWFGYGTETLYGSWGQYVPLALAMFTVVYGAMRAVREVHWKRRLAYSTVANLSYILFGVYLMTKEGLIGALLHMAFHAEIKILAFFCAGAVLHVNHREYVTEMDGLGRKMKWTFACFTVSALALTGIPPFAGFISKWYLLTAAGHAGTVEGYIGAGAILTAALLTAVYMLSMVRRAFFPDKGADLSRNETAKEAGGWMLVPMIILAIGIVLTGLFPGVVIKSAEAIANTVRAAGGEF
ncbi:MAG: proton-conducting membrane transporter [Lachnospiraceae bacterium]|nr:proton-conducting membrane transporter [Lachnospiraceae bacterium]